MHQPIPKLLKQETGVEKKEGQKLGVGSGGWGVVRDMSGPWGKQAALQTNT